MILYVTTGVWGAGVGRQLTAAEIDGNIWDLDSRLETLESNPPTPINIQTIQVTGSQMTIILEDYTEFGPFTIPTSQWTFMNEWADATVYVQNNVFTKDYALYLVNVNHVSAAPFDANASSIDGLLYTRLLAPPNPPVDVVLSQHGLIGGVSATLVTYVAPRDLVIPADFAGSKAFVAVPVGGEYPISLPIYASNFVDDPVQVGTLTFEFDSRFGVFSVGSPTEDFQLAEGMVLTIGESDIDDGALADLSVTLVMRAA